ncbi:uridine kinase [Oceanobacillus oncorhynchi subsp. incaldanensis]|uniref:Uridine kinase n=1 Tax=Oceanobacillus oncorhynchi TaxID=545501 RepID=A0A0A1MLB1_9BACI|nr:uridine kinase [Oceanobacillus oncorhynchi]UUI38182.1 uridine kinase [Oceanobacillus oncorhynchi]GIO17108.1 uridine kinase [Oceanobacillus oncorhynchi subsp. incaldanensis]CEI83843.1 Uridine kinase [Oceanobacillus oncorhynchi]
MEKNKPVVIGVAGGSGSGKTSVTRAIYERFKETSILVIEQDAYYKDQSHLPFEERLKTNYDHPLAFDNDLLVEHLQQLLEYKSIEKPIYDYKVHNRSTETIHVEPKEVIIVEGILILEDANLVDLMDIKVFVDTDADLRIIRRLLRDIKDRGRTLDSVIDQYIQVVRPAHMQFIEPSKRYADLIIPEGGENHVAVDIMASKIENILVKNSNL